jgi:hypothetical protein
MEKLLEERVIQAVEQQVKGWSIIQSKIEDTVAWDPEENPDTRAVASISINVEATVGQQKKSKKLSVPVAFDGRGLDIAASELQRLVVELGDDFGPAEVRKQGVTEALKNWLDENRWTIVKPLTALAEGVSKRSLPSEVAVINEFKKPEFLACLDEAGWDPAWAKNVLRRRGWIIEEKSAKLVEACVNLWKVTAESQQLETESDTQLDTPTNLSS